MPLIRNFLVMGALVGTTALAQPQIDHKKSVFTADGSVVELIHDSHDPLLFYRLPHEFAVARDSDGLAIQVIEGPKASTYDFTWRAEDWSGQTVQVQDILKRELGPGVQVRVIFPALETLTLDQELFDGFDATFENFSEVGPFLPDSRQTFRLTIPKKNVSRFRKALVQGSGFYLPLTFSMTLPDPDRPGQLISLPYASTLFLGGLSSCALIPSLNC
ncbi:MAG TPA: hypothetical protein VE954_18605 [Oligoflexus sp.]|uniref:hypothetical protein n=1 Tax=Oligoflexus sp. TaxID=1971216 RepID=UPI002D3F095E|nr:hypothetical protein [Oligoflexus sp.]HYX35112.1 hypothetical protein [Oligoflexus sp.]